MFFPPPPSPPRGSQRVSIAFLHADGTPAGQANGGCLQTPPMRFCRIRPQTIRVLLHPADRGPDLLDFGWGRRDLRRRDVQVGPFVQEGGDGEWSAEIIYLNEPPTIYNAPVHLVLGEIPNTFLKATLIAEILPTEGASALCDG